MLGQQIFLGSSHAEEVLKLATLPLGNVQVTVTSGDRDNNYARPVWSEDQRRDYADLLKEKLLD